MIPTGRFVITFASAQTAGHVRMRLSDQASLSVRVDGPGVAFESREQELVVRNSSATTHFEIEIPKRAAHVEVRFPSGSRFVARDGRVLSRIDATADGWYVLAVQ